MKLFQATTQEHEEFRLRLEKDRDVELAAIDVQRQIAEAFDQLVGR